MDYPTKPISKKFKSQDQIVKENRLRREQILELREKFKVYVEGFGSVYESDLEPVFDGYVHLIGEVERLQQELSQLQTSYRAINDDFRALIDIMDRAKKMAFLAEDEEIKPKFRMDAEGNLCRIEDDEY
jgi:prespore-specific regulator